MKTVKFIHAADFHLDAAFCGGRAGYGAIRRADMRQAFQKTVSLALAEEVDFLFLCGDLYEHSSVARNTIAFVVRELSRLTHTQVFLLSGNHDPLLKDAWYFSVPWPEHVHLLQSQGALPGQIFLNEDNIFVVGVGFSAFTQGRPDFSTLPAPVPGTFNVLLYHGSLNAPEGDPHNATTTEELRSTGYDYVAMGHYHTPQIVPGNPIIAYAGSPEPLGFDEPGIHGVLMGEAETGEKGYTVNVRLKPLATREYIEKTLDITALLDEDAVKVAIAACLETMDPNRYLPHIRLVGMPLEPPHMEPLTDYFLADWLLFRLSDDTMPPVGWMESLPPDSLTGVFLRMVSEEMKQVENQPALDDAARQEAVQCLYQARQMALEALAYGTVHFLPELP